MDKKVRLITTEEEIKIISDPYRLKILKTYQRSKEPMTVKNVADKMGEVPANVHYHVKKLLSINILELDHIEVVNGINAKFYRLVDEEFTIDFTGVNDSVEYKNNMSNVEIMVTTLIDEFKTNFCNLVRKGESDDKKEKKADGMLSSPPLYLSEQDFQDLSKDIKELVDKYSEDGEDKIEYSSLIGIVKNI